MPRYASKEAPSKRIFVTSFFTARTSYFRACVTTPWPHSMTLLPLSSTGLLSSSNNSNNPLIYANTSRENGTRGDTASAPDTPACSGSLRRRLSVSQCTGNDAALRKVVIPFKVAVQEYKHDPFDSINGYPFGRQGLHNVVHIFAGVGGEGEEVHMLMLHVGKRNKYVQFCILIAIR